MKLKTIKVQEGGFVNLDDFADLINIKRVKYYELVHNANKGTLILMFFDKDKKIVKPKKKLTKTKKNKKIKK